METGLLHCSLRETGTGRVEPTGGGVQLPETAKNRQKEWRAETEVGKVTDNAEKSWLSGYHVGL